MTDDERRLDAAREQLRHAMSSKSAHALNVSSPGVMSFHENMVHANLLCLRRAVLEHKAKVTAERKLDTLRRLSGQFVNMRHPSFLRDAVGRRVEDQSRWGGIVHEHLLRRR